MLRPASARTAQEPRHRRQTRLIYALLAFPAAGIVGFTGSAIVKSVRSESAPIVSPATPDPVEKHRPSSYEKEEEQNPPRDDHHVMPNV
jgi:hypothetical protein